MCWRRGASCSFTSPGWGHHWTLQGHGTGMGMCVAARQRRPFIMRLHPHRSWWAGCRWRWSMCPAWVTCSGSTSSCRCVLCRPGARGMAPHTTFSGTAPWRALLCWAVAAALGPQQGGHRRHRAASRGRWSSSRRRRQRGGRDWRSWRGGRGPAGRRPARRPPHRAPQEAAARHIAPRPRALLRLCG